MREKLIRLQSLYIDQFKRLQHLLKEKKRRYLHNRKVEHEALGKFYAKSNKLLWVEFGSSQTYFCLGALSGGEFGFETGYLMATDFPIYFLLIWKSILDWLLSEQHLDCCDSPGSSLLTGPEGLLAKERENLKRLKCLRRYRQRYGVEALLHRQLKERRMLATDGAAQQVICVHTSKMYTFALFRKLEYSSKHCCTVLALKSDLLDMGYVEKSTYLEVQGHGFQPQFPSDQFFACTDKFSALLFSSAN